MTFAFGLETRRRVIRSLANLSRFEGNERTALDEGLVGLPGPYRRLINARYGALPREYAVGLDEADYVVYCYGTPIAWVLRSDGYPDRRVNYVPDWQYSSTTTYYQGLVMEAWGNCVDPYPRKSRQDNRGTPRGRSAEARYAATQVLPSAATEHASREVLDRLVTNHRGVQYDPQVERDTSYERDMAPARGGSYRSRLGRLLDPRYSDPDWVPPTEPRPSMSWEPLPPRPGQHPAHP